MMNQPTPPTQPKENHVDYIILAQFDIDKGSTIKHQYPRPTGVDEQLLAELMLPDGAHKRDDDWTVFFLNRSETDATNANKKYKRRPTIAQPSSPAAPSPVIGAFIYQFSASDEEQGWVMVHPDVMNITLNSTNISIVSKDGLHKFRIEYHEALEYTQLEPLFSCVLIDADTALGVRFMSAGDEGIFLGKVESILRAGPQAGELSAAAIASAATPATPASPTSTNTTVYVDHSSSTTHANRTTPFLYCINFLNNLKDDTVRRGAVVRALAVCTRHNYIHVFKPFILLALQRYFAHPSEEVLADLFNSLNDMDTDKMPTLNYNQRLIVRAASDRTKQNFATSIQYIGTKMNVQLPLAVFPDEVGDVSVITLVQKFGAQVMTIFNAILSEKRVLFLGFGCSAGEVCNYVLAATCMVCPPLTGLIGRVFPYTNLCYLDFLSVPGYITGVTNPMFEEHPEWWDLLCNISTGKVTLNPLLVQDVPEKYVANDNELMSEVMYNVTSHYGEDKVKSLFQDYTQHIIDLAFDEEEFASEEERQLELDANKVRLESWKRTTTYQNHIYNRELRSKISAIRDPMVPRYIRKLRKKKSLPESEVLAMYRCFLTEIKTEDQLLEFLSYLPEANGGLYPIAVSLFHSSEPVQHATVELLNRLQGISTGSSLLSSLNPFLFRAYERKFRQFNGTPS